MLVKIAYKNFLKKYLAKMSNDMFSNWFMLYIDSATFGM